MIINLQNTDFDSEADLRIWGYADEVFEKLMDILGLDIPEYQPQVDFVQTEENSREKKELPHQKTDKKSQKKRDRDEKTNTFDSETYTNDKKGKKKKRK